jgi:hypothetical protein
MFGCLDVYSDNINIETKENSTVDSSTSKQSISNNSQANSSQTMSSVVHPNDLQLVQMPVDPSQTVDVATIYSNHKYGFITLTPAGGFPGDFYFAPFGFFNLGADIHITRTISENHIIDDPNIGYDYTLFCNFLSDHTITLPNTLSNGSYGRILVIKDVSGTANINHIILTAIDNQTVEGSISYQLPSISYIGVSIQSDHSGNWFVISKTN